jgi:hypothetical protein
MCQSLQVLHHDQTGYVMHCAQCQHFHVGYGNLGLTITERELRSLMEEMGMQLQQWADRIHPGEKRFAFNTDSRRVTMLFCYREMQQCHEILAQGLLQWQARRLMQDQC